MRQVIQKLVLLLVRLLLLLVFLAGHLDSHWRSLFGVLFCKAEKHNRVHALAQLGAEDILVRKAFTSCIESRQDLSGSSPNSVDGDLVLLVEVVHRHFFVFAKASHGTVVPQHFVAAAATVQFVPHGLHPDVEAERWPFSLVIAAAAFLRVN